jgi:hypothetical protein
MDKFDVEGARAAGYTDAEIADYLADQDSFDAAAARKAGYTDAEIIGYISAAPAASTAAKPVEKPKSTFTDDAAQLLGVTNSAILPYATMAGLGAAAGAPFAGIGAVPGAAGGILSLGISDLGTNIYNAGASLLGGKPAQLPSETIRRLYENVGVGRRPQTPGQEVLFSAAEGAAGGLSGATAFNRLAQRTAPGVTRNIMQELGRAPGVQTAAGAGAATAPTIGREYAGIENPLAQFGLSVAGGMAGGRMATPRPRTVTSGQLATRAQEAYGRAEQAGVRFNPASISNLGNSIRRSFTTHPKVQFDPSLHPRINTVLQRIEEASVAAQQSGTPISFSQVELLRRIARTAANSLDRDERRLGADVIRQIDNFVQAPPPKAIVSGQGPDAARAVTEARAAWRRMSQADALDTIVERASNSAQGLNASSLRAQARAIANNPNRMRGFDPDIQTEIRSLARGNRGLSTLQTIGQFAPSFNLRNLPGSAVTAGAGGALYSGSPTAAAVGVGLGATGMAAKTAANRMATGRVASMADRARGTPKREMPLPQIAAQVAQQYNFPVVHAETGEDLVDVTMFEGYPVPIYGTRSKEFRFEEYNKMRR